VDSIGPIADSSVTPSITAELRSVGVELREHHGPRTGQPLVQVLVRGGQATELEIGATVGTLLKSGCQDFHVTIMSTASHPRLEAWLADDRRFAFVEGKNDVLLPSTYTLVIPAGVALGVHSLEATIEALRETRCLVLRALVDGRSDAIELWQTPVLRSYAAQGDPEKLARRAGGERWVSGNGLGLHDYRQPKPKLHLRRGAAAALDLNILVRDLTDRSVRGDYEQRILQLESRLRKSEVERRRLEQGLAPNRGLARVRAAARKGPVYLLARLRARAGQRS
jgi:hypothetical protein